MNDAVTFHHVDVFSEHPYSGNSLAVFVEAPEWDASQMAEITRELRHFETIFVSAPEPGSEKRRVRVFDLEGELDFAGHPLLGAAGVLHRLTDPAAGDHRTWHFETTARTVEVDTVVAADGRVTGVLDQGRPEFLGQPAGAEEIAASLGLDVSDLDPEHPPQVWSTGLRYLVVPVSGASALSRARISRSDFAKFLDSVGAQFVYVLALRPLEGRHWNNDGVFEDVATGSAAGCVAAYLLDRGLTRSGDQVTLQQGRFLGRASLLMITAFGAPGDVERVTVAGGISTVAAGQLLAVPRGTSPAGHSLHQS